MALTRAKTRLRQVKQVLYRLKRDFGIPADLYRKAQGTRNLKTGAKGTTYSVIRLRRMILLPVNTMPKFEYDLSFIAHNKNFTYGAIFEVGDRRVIIDAKDLPDGHNIEDTTDYVVFNAKRYEVVSVKEFEPGLGFTLHAREAQTQPPLQILAPPLASGGVGTGQTITGVKA